MDYQKKVEYADRVAQQLQGQKSKAEIRTALLAEGLYERDINNIMVSAQNILGETYQSKIKEYLLNDKSIHDDPTFSSLDREMLENLIKRASQNIALSEKKKITQLLKEGLSPEETIEQVDARFLSLEKAAEQIARVQDVKQENSGSGRMLNIGGGIGLIVLTGIILLATDRLFYVLPIIGLIMIVKGFTTKRMEFED